MLVKKEQNKLQVYSDIKAKDQCRNIPAGKWNRAKKCWEYPLTSVVDIIKEFKGKLRVTREVDKLYKDQLELSKRLAKIVRGENLDPHPFLMEHQKKCRKIAELFDRFAFFAETGTGKTLMSLQIIEDKAVKFLVVAPKPTIKDAWLGDANTWFPNMRLLPISRNMKKQDYIDIYTKWYGKCSANINRMGKDKLKEYLAERAEVLVINPESFKIDIEFIESMGVEGMVFDESALLRNNSSQITKEVTKFAGKIKYLYILSGEPDPNGKLEYFTQMRIIDPAILGTTFSSFRNKYFMPTGYMGYQWEPFPWAKEAVTQRISRRAIVIKKKDCLDLPEEVYQTRTVELSSKAMKHYKTMRNQQMVFLKDGNIAATTKGAVINKLLQITSGFVYDTQNDGKVEYLHNDKMNTLKEVLDEIGNHQVIIWGTFRPEIEAIEDMLQSMGKTVVTAYGGTKDVDQSIVDFKTGKAQYLVANPKSIKYGVTLVNCSYAVYYSLSHSYEDYKQSKDRILRKGQTESCTIIFLITEGTIDRHVYNVVHNKGKEADIITALIEEYSKEVGDE